ncbi:MAG TPA: DUF5107 domain-containing protein [Chloroflexia bacterium]|nr:DUF5107 domain-containing protein [Chloroflexia bacterium]
MEKGRIQKNRRQFLIILCVTLCAFASLRLEAPSYAQGEPQGSGRLYPQTGKTLAPEFIEFYDAHGGVPIFGYPLTEVEIEGGFKVQYLERARIEHHPENRGTAYEVQLGLLGTILTAGRQFAPAPPGLRSNSPSTIGAVYFPETVHTLSGKFLEYWQENGGLALFGYPISEPVEEGGYTVQYFERNRFELHPENEGTPYEVLLGLLGRDSLAQRVQVKENSVTLPTYAYEQGYVVSAQDAISPYPRLDRSKVGPPSMRPYRLIVLENHYLRLTIMPDLGGRLYEVIYKPTGHNEMYRNPVIKPSTFGERGWWLAAGGTEWAAPTQEHGLMEYLPWEAAIMRNVDGGATVTVSATDRLTGMKVTGTITLSPEESAYTLTARMENRTTQPQRGQLWTNAMLAPGGTNHASPRTHFIVPHTQVVVHSTSDANLPPEHGVVNWPRHEGRDLGDMSTWKGWLGAFALPGAQRGSFAAVYNPDADEGMVKTFKGSEMPGLKIFGFGPGFDPKVYTDDNSSYAELWGGITPTFWDNSTFPPGSSLGWTERWQPVAGVGGVSLAGAWGTVSLGSDGKARIMPTRRSEGATLIVRKQGGGETSLTFSAYPDRPTVVALPSGTVAEIEVVGVDGKSLLKGVPVK